jgi:hypothetical protein
MNILINMHYFLIMLTKIKDIIRFLYKNDKTKCVNRKNTIKKGLKQVLCPSFNPFFQSFRLSLSFGGDYRTRTGHLDTASVAL